MVSQDFDHGVVTSDIDLLRRRFHKMPLSLIVCDQLAAGEVVITSNAVPSWR